MFSLSMEMSRMTRDGTAEPVSRDQILRHVRGQGNIHFPCSADHEQDWQPYPIDRYSAICDDIHTCRVSLHDLAHAVSGPTISATCVHVPGPRGCPHPLLSLWKAMSGRVLGKLLSRGKVVGAPAITFL